MIISDSTTLIILFDTQRVDLLKNIFTTIYIPRTVYQEISFKKDIDLPDYIQIVDVKKDTLLDDLLLVLDDGESEAISFAKQKNLPLIIDEKKGRKIAKNLNIEIIGLLGIIYLNIKKGFIKKGEAKIFIDEIVSNGYRISNKLIENMLKQT